MFEISAKVKSFRSNKINRYSSANGGIGPVTQIGDNIFIEDLIFVREQATGEKNTPLTTFTPITVWRSEYKEKVTYWLVTDTEKAFTVVFVKYGDIFVIDKWNHGLIRFALLGSKKTIHTPVINPNLTCSIFQPKLTVNLSKTSPQSCIKKVKKMTPNSKLNLHGHE